MEHRQLYPASLRPRGQLHLRVIQSQCGRQRADLLGRIRVAEHHLEPAAGLGEPALHGREVEHVLHHRRCAAQVVDGFEQRDDVQHGRFAGRALCQLVYGSDIVDASGEAHDVAPASAGAEPRLHVRDRFERVEHVAGHHRWLLLRAKLLERLRMDCAVLPDLELGQMETECFRLPDQVLQLAVGLSRRAPPGQRVLRAPKVRN